MNTKRVMTCLVAGVCVLAVSAVAAFGSVNGYGNYKTAVKTLALETDNVSASGTYTMTYDGQTVMKGEVDLACDGANQSSHTALYSGDGTQGNESWDTTLNGVNTWFNSDEDHYYTAQAKRVKSGHGLLDVGGDDEFAQRVVTLMEMGADTVMGDLKNNVVEIDVKDGIYTYQLDISNSQVPPLVNAALSVMAYAVTDSMNNTSYVDFEDWQQAAVRYYEEKTGETLPQEFIDMYFGCTEVPDDWWENNETLQKFSELEGEMHGSYYQELEKKMEAANTTSGVLYVANDGTTTFYPDVKDYKEAKGLDSLNDFEDFIGKDLTLDNVHFVFSINKAGQLTANNMVATFTTVDLKGVSHTIALTVDATLFDYGTTKVQPLDVGDRINWDETHSDWNVDEGDGYIEIESN